MISLPSWHNFYFALVAVRLDCFPFFSDLMLHLFTVSTVLVSYFLNISTALLELL